MDTAPVDHADIIRTRADRIATLVRDNVALLRRHGVDTNHAIVTIRREGIDAVRSGVRAYDALPYAARIANRLDRVADRLTGTRVAGSGPRATIVASSDASARAADGDNLRRMASRITLDILADRADDPLFDVR